MPARKRMEDEFTINDRRMKPKLKGFFWRGGVPLMHLGDELQNTRIGVFLWWRADHGLNLSKDGPWFCVAGRVLDDYWRRHGRNPLARTNGQPVPEQAGPNPEARIQDRQVLRLINRSEKMRRDVAQMLKDIEERCLSKKPLPPRIRQAHRRLRDDLRRLLGLRPPRPPRRPPRSPSKRRHKKP